MKKITLVVNLILTLNVAIYSQWVYQGAWPNENYKGGTHGMAVSPDGKVWTSSFFSTLWNGIPVSPILVFNPDGSFVDTIYTVTIGGVTDTLGVGNTNSGCRGLAIDENGNVIYVSAGPARMYKINYQTMEGMFRRIPETGSSPTKPAVASDGTVFVGPVVGEGLPSTKISMYATDFLYLGDAVQGPPSISRTMEVSSNGLTLYWTVFFGEHKGIYIYKRLDEFSAFELTDSLLQGMSIETAAWNPATGHLWISHDSRGTGPYTHLTWYSLDVNQKVLVDSFHLPIHNPINLDEYPRGLAFSPDGQTAYVGLFGETFDRIYKFTRVIPVELTSFTATKVSKDVELNWSTASEINNRGFEIQRRAVKMEISGIKAPFDEIGFVEGNGTTTEKNTYYFLDKNILSGKYEYRLKQIDLDGTFEYSNIVNIDVNNNLNFSMHQNYPNPFNPVTTINFTLPEDVENVKLNIYDILGQKVSELVNGKLNAGYHSYQWNAVDFSTGLYIYELRTEKFSAIKKMILIK